MPEIDLISDILLEPINWVWTKLISVMVYPNDERFRQELLCWTAVDAKRRLYEGDRPREVVTVIEKIMDRYFRENGGYETLVNAPSYDDVVKRTEKSLITGSIAGDVLLAVVKIDKHNNTGSIKKAVHVLQEFYKHWETANGKSMPTNDKTIRKAWTEYKTVAHFWAVSQAEYGFRADIELGIPSDINNFLAGAEWFRHFGESHIPKFSGDNTPTLSPEDTWKVPPDYPLPPLDYEIPALEDWEIEILENYRAPQEL